MPHTEAIMNSPSNVDPAMAGFFKTRGYVPGGIITNSRQENLDMEALPPFLRTLLVTDGTVTKSLEAYFWEPISIENLGQREIQLTEDVPWLGMEMGADALVREVLLRGENSRNIYAYAKSIINIRLLPSSIGDDLLAGKIGIGEILRERGLETYREVVDIGRQTDRSLAPVLGAAQCDELLYRSYRVVINHQPTLLITEKFPYRIYLK